MFPYIIRAVRIDEFNMIRETIAQNYFLEKHSWTKSLSDMAYDGLIQGKWFGVGCFGENEEIMSYFDYKVHKDGNIEIGICLTVEEYRGRGLAKLLLNFLIACYPNQEIIIGTSEENLGMIACIEKVGFKEEYRILNDRINGAASIHYRYLPNKRSN